MNRKGFFAVVVQAGVTADHKFVFLSVMHGGETHDSTAFQATPLYKLITDVKVPNCTILIGDDAYANELNVVKPYAGRNISNDEDSFNFYNSSCRMAIEQAFGMLVNRFGMF